MKKRVKRAKEWKKGQVAEIKESIAASKTVGVVKIRGLGAKQLQRIRKEFREKARLRVSKNSLISLSLRESGSGTEKGTGSGTGSGMQEMVDFVEDQTGLIFTDLDAFELFKVLEAGKIPAPIKAGAVAPHEIAIEEGPTSLKPGPVVGELQNLGIPAGISGGKVTIKKRKVAVAEGERVSPGLAEMLARLEIYPVKEGLDLCAVFDCESQVLFTPEVLQIDTTKYFADLKEVARAAFSVATHIKYDYSTRFTVGSLLAEASVKSQALALEIAYPTALTIKPLLQKAYSDALNLSVNACVYERETVGCLLAKARTQAESLARCAGLGEGGVGERE